MAEQIPLARMCRLLAARARLQAAQLDVMAAVADLGTSVAAFASALAASEAKDIADHPDLAELNVQMDSYYDELGGR